MVLCAAIYRKERKNMDKTIKTALSEKEREMLAQRHFAFFDRYKDMSLVSLENAPDLLFRPGEETYTGDGTIVLGLDQEFLASAHDEPEFINASLYLLGHEMQHDLSTADKAWKWGLSKGKKTVFECLADRLEGKGRRFSRQSGFAISSRTRLRTAESNGSARCILCHLKSSETISVESSGSLPMNAEQTIPTLLKS